MPGYFIPCRLSFTNVPSTKEYKGLVLAFSLARFKTIEMRFANGQRPGNKQLHNKRILAKGNYLAIVPLWEFKEILWPLTKIFEAANFLKRKFSRRAFFKPSLLFFLLGRCPSTYGLLKMQSLWTRIGKGPCGPSR